VILTCYTNDRYYIQKVNGLYAWAIANHARFEAITYKGVGSWLANCRKKPGIMLKWMDNNSGETFFFTDADSRIVGDLSILDKLGKDIWFVKKPGGHRLKVYASGILVRPSGRRFVELWAKECAKRRYFNVSDHTPLCITLDKFGDAFDIGYLPPGYCQVGGPINEDTKVYVHVSDTELKNEWRRSCGKLSPTTQ
jgi:hypothetical protein